MAEKKKLSKEEFLEILNSVEWATLNVTLKEKFNCLLIPEEKWQSVTDALYNEVGDDGWNPSWEY